MGQKLRNRMNFKQFLIINYIINIYILSVLTDVEACGICVTALFDRIIPPILLWCLFAIIWFLAVSIIVTIHGNKIGGIPSLVKAMLFVLFLVIIGSMLIGPIGVLLLLTPYPVIVWKAFKKNDRTLGKRVKNSLKIITVISLIAFMGLIFYRAYIFRVRTPSEYILEWESTAPSRMYLKGLTKRGPEYLPYLREVIERGNISSVAIAVEGLADFGQSDIDVPILIQTLGRYQGNASFNKYSKRFGTALRKLSGIDLPDTTSYREWRDNWEKRKFEEVIKPKG
jgi:hypothetical protein